MGQEAADYQPIITSHDGYSSYLLVVDAHTIPHHADPDHPHSFVDADWGGDRSHRTNGNACRRCYCVLKKIQSAVSLSSTEAEFTVAAEAEKWPST